MGRVSQSGENEEARRGTPQAQPQQPALMLTGGSLHSRRSAGVPGADGDTSSPFLGTTGYDDVEEVSLAYPHEDTQDVTPEPRAQEFQSPRPAEPSPAEQLGAAGREESSVPLGEP